MLTLNLIGKIPDSIKLKSEDFSSILAAAHEKLKHFKRLHGSVELRFVGEATMRKLNCEYAGNDYVTDVLSFDYAEGQVITPGNEVTAGIIMICTQQLIRQSRHHGVSPESEAILLFTHGLIHLSGFDHGSELDQARFAQLQGDIMKHNGYQGRNFTWSH